MLSTTTPGTVSGTTGSQQQNADVGATMSSNAAAALGSSPTGSSSGLKTVKGEPYSTLSPENASNQTMSDDASAGTSVGGGSGNKNGASHNNGGSGSGSGSNNASNASGASAEGVPSATGSTPNMLRQNSSGSINSCLAGSPNNTSDHSNSSNVSASIAQIVEGGGTSSCDLLQDDKKKKINIKEEDGGKSQPGISTDKSNSSSSSSGGNGGSGSGAGGNGGSNVKGAVAGTLANVTVKEEPTDILGSFVNLKKEENLSPNMSPVGFGSIGGPPGSVQDRSVTPVKMELNPNNGGGGGSGTHNNNNNNNTEKTSSALDDIAGCNPLSADNINESSNSGPGSGTGGAGGGPGSTVSGGPAGSGGGGGGVGPGGIGIGGLNVPPVGGNFIGGNAGGPLGNCLDYMQQQNHIFVFSTQLANKGAESVLSGQFQTIIAYHCTQPATKSFLEDFFMKNPMKMNKLQRQNSLGICNMPGSGGQPWMPGGGGAGGGGPSVVSKMLQQQPQQQKQGGPKAHFNQAENSNKATGLRGAMPGNFGGDNSDSLVNESELMCWETGSRNNMEGNPTESQALKLLEGGVDSIVGGLGKCGDLSNESNIISLQGVKVPDENLTPQQRQHREEQLAKIKKMNQFLFPENDSGGQMPGAGNQLGKLTNEQAMAGNLPPNMIMSMGGGGPGGPGPTMVNPALNPQMRQMQSNLLAQNSQKSEHVPATLGEDVLLPGDVMSDMGPGMPCNSGPKSGCGGGPVNAPGGLQCGPGGVMNVNVANIVGNNIQCPGGGGPGGNLMTNSPEIMGAFGSTNCGVIGGGGPGGDMNKNVPNPDGMPQVGMAQMEWSKIQHQFFEERLKGNKPGGCRPSGMAGPGSGGAVPPPPMGGGPANQQQQSLRNNVQGPPPPYHPTQRSASVPIATQSPNPSSPNNLSLPSPRTTGGALGIPSNSPSMEATATNTSAAGNTATSAAGAMNALAASKNCFQSDAGSPSNRQRSGGGAGPGAGNTGNVMNHLNSNPSTPLSHLSPKELDSFSQASSAGDMKGTRPSPQRPRSPGNTGSHLIEPNNMEPRFPASSPGLNFNTHMQSNTNTAMNAYKGPGSNNALERQNSGPGGPVQFARRSDNMPLNPNSSNRPPQNKMAQNFDPISSLAQMSQQLTSCVSGVGSPAGGMNMMGPGDMNIGQGVEHGMMAGIDGGSMEHMNHGGVGAGSNSCHPINPLMNSMGQRMLNPKMCGAGGGFNAAANGVIRDGPGGPNPNFHGIMPPARMMSRMPVNFGPNFNPNIQVKASTPNTIQYMPVRPQNNNNGSNVRMPPSLEFLQRYANPQMAGGGGPPMGNDLGMMVGVGPINMNSPSEQQLKMANQPGGMPNNAGGNGNGMNFFQNCNQLPGLDDEGGLMPGHDGLGIGQPPMIRGMRPHGMRGLGARLQAPGGNIVNRQQPQFPGTPDGLDCNDPTAMFNNAGGPCNSVGPMFPASQQQQQQQAQQKPQHLKGMPAGMCQNAPGGGGVGGNVVLPGNSPATGGPVMLPGDMGQSVMGPNNNNVMAGVGNSGGVGGGVGVGNNANPNYKPFVGPSSNDLKYAQQYHSFQQQLYATNTRSQQQQQGAGNMNAMPPNLSPNPAFFVNK
ncbi:protein BCL9 homolog [Scaptodrosophila lebanonensis]|uniref:Protein BCL9 homolog n=1 Tax=Drosophila lebanonensis TaxID=7225 RepID=A0A6J2TW06_DROLE|nr:protein BCL9 homolog [Scaptodrosophila lebanonensis]